MMAAPFRGPMHAAADIVPIVAVAYQRVIGIENRLPWRLPEDLRRFKATTTGHPIVMGRKTWESIGRPLPGRTNIVVTRQADYPVPPGVRLSPSPEEAFRLGAGLGAQVFVIGGRELYAAALPLAARIDATLVYRAFPGDAHFPALGPDWHLAAREDFESAQPADGPLRGSFVRLERRAAADACALCLVRAGRPLAAAPSPWESGLELALRDLVAPTGAPPAARAPER